MPVNTYDAGLVRTIKGLLDDGLTPAQMHDSGAVHAPVKTILAIIRDVSFVDGNWEAVMAKSVLDDDDDAEEVKEVYDAASDKPHDFGTPEAEAADGIPRVAADQASQISQQIADSKVPRKKIMRGHKSPNVADNKALNAARRRRRGGNPADMRRRLLMDVSRKNPDFEYRWVLDRPGRIAEKTQFDDWDIVTDAHMLEGQSGSVSAVAGTNHYNANKMILLRKPKLYFEQDARDKLNIANELENQIRRGPGEKDGSSSVDSFGPKEVMERMKKSGADFSNTYVPVGEKISIGQVSETP